MAAKTWDEIYGDKAPQRAITSDETKIDITDKDALRKLAINTLVSVIQANPTALAVVPALKELFDRVDGKAPQSVYLDAEVRSVTINASVEFIPARRDNLIQGAVDNSQVIDN